MGQVLSGQSLVAIKVCTPGNRNGSKTGVGVLGTLKSTVFTIESAPM
jgi:hypothetical protein